MYRSLTIQTFQYLETAYREGRRKLSFAEVTLDPDSFQRLDAELTERVQEARLEAARELELPATLLVGREAGLFAEVDRLRAEGDLRMAVFPPLVALGVLLGHCGSPWWYLLIPAAAVLFVQGVQKDLDAKKIISDAIGMERIKAASVTKFSLWVDDVLPAEIKRIQSS